MKRAKRRNFRRGIRDMLGLLPQISNPALNAAIESASMGQDKNFVISRLNHPEIVARSLGELASLSENRKG